ncbi:hypothetical protein VCHC42A1_2395, partial [Vibrio cholerae HC-42A1]
MIFCLVKKVAKVSTCVVD